MSTDGLYRPKPVEGDIPADEIEYVELFVALDELTEKTGNAERVVLLLSTCRNIWMTINAIFVDLKDVLGQHERYDRFSELIFELGRGDGSHAGEIRNAINSSLREAGRKIEVWENRADLMAAIEKVIEGEQSGRRRSRLHQLMARQRQRRPGLNGEHGQFLVLDPGTTPAKAEELFGVLVAARQRLLAISETAFRMAPISTALRPVLRPDEDLEGTIFAADPETLAPDIRSRVVGGWSETGKSLKKAQVLIPSLASAADRADAVQISDISLVEMGEEFSQMLSSLKEAILAEQDLLAEVFQANFPTAPMPPPFQVDLSRVSAQNGSRDRRQFEVKIVTSDAYEERDTARIALLTCGLPESSYSHVNANDYCYDDDSKIADQVVEAAKRAIQAASEADCVLLAMPEVFLPRSHADEVVGLAREKGLLLVAGLEYRQGSDHKKAINEVVVALPGVREVSRPRKQRPSVYEIRGDDFEANESLVFFRHTPVGNLGVIVCSDYLEIDIVAALADAPERLDTLLVVARNPAPDVFEALARADALRLYASVGVVNSRPDKGSGDDRKPSTSVGTLVAVPTSRGLLPPAMDDVGLDVSWDGDEPPALKVFDLPLAAIRARDRRRPMDGFLPPPFHARGHRE